MPAIHSSNLSHSFWTTAGGMPPAKAGAGEVAHEVEKPLTGWMPIGAFKGNRMGKRGASAKLQTSSGGIQRISLSFAGGPVAVQVSGDPDPANNGLFHIYTDHLGSTGSLSDSSGVYIPDSHAKYTPFGDWRTEPTATAGDRYYTGHKHNNLGGGANDLGLIYMNARFYLPGVGRFASADTIVPDPANPQAYNRYSYGYNNPIRYSDPTGHCAETGDDACWSYYDRIIQLCPECAGLGWEQWGYNFQRDTYNWLKNGGQLGESTAFSVDYDALADIVSNIELGVDTYDQAAKLLRNSTDDVVPGPVGLGLIMLQTGLDHGDGNLAEFGYYLIARAAADGLVDAAAVAAAGAAVGEIGGPPGIVVGIGLFVAIELGGGELSDYIIDEGWKALNTDQTPRVPIAVPYDPENPRVRTPPPTAPSTPRLIGTPLPPN